jgi:hypothetical protein
MGCACHKVLTTEDQEVLRNAREGGCYIGMNVTFYVNSALNGLHSSHRSFLFRTSRARSTFLFRLSWHLVVCETWPQVPVVTRGPSRNRKEEGLMHSERLDDISEAEWRKVQTSTCARKVVGLAEGEHQSGRYGGGLGQKWACSFPMGMCEVHPYGTRPPCRTLSWPVSEVRIIC